MKIFNLVCAGCVEKQVEASSKTFVTREAARAAMQENYKETLAAWEFDAGDKSEFHHCEIEDDKAFIEDYSDTMGWTIEEHDLELPAVSVAIEVSGGMVQNVYSDGEHVGVDVYDLDVSDFPSEGEEDEEETCEAELEEIKNNPDWKCIW